MPVFGVGLRTAYSAVSHPPSVSAPPSAAGELRKLRVRMKRRAESLLSDAALAEELGEAGLAETLLAASLLAESAGRSAGVAKTAHRRRGSGERARPVVERRPANSPMRAAPDEETDLPRRSPLRGGEIGRFGIGAAWSTKPKTVHVIGVPGAGKTSLLSSLLRALWHDELITPIRYPTLLPQTENLVANRTVLLWLRHRQSRYSSSTLR